MEMNLLDAAMKAYAEHGWLGFLGILLTGLVGLYKLPVLQNVLPETMRWENLNPMLRTALVFVFSLLGFGLGTFVVTHSWVAALGAGVQAALVAMGGKAVFDSMSPPKPPPLIIPHGTLETESTHSIQTRLPVNK